MTAGFPVSDSPDNTGSQSGGRPDNIPQLRSTPLQIILQPSLPAGSPDWQQTAFGAIAINIGKINIQLYEIWAQFRP